jgi:hypothetical protein
MKTRRRAVGIVSRFLLGLPESVACIEEYLRTMLSQNDIGD